MAQKKTKQGMKRLFFLRLDEGFITWTSKSLKAEKENEFCSFFPLEIRCTKQLASACSLRLLALSEVARSWHISDLNMLSSDLCDLDLTNGSVTASIFFSCAPSADKWNTAQEWRGRKFLANFILLLVMQIPAKCTAIYIRYLFSSAGWQVLLVMSCS